MTQVYNISLNEECFNLTLGVFSSARQTRQQQLVNWCGGPDFDGCLIFDECHKVKHFVPVTTKIILQLFSRKFFLLISLTSLCSVSKLLVRVRCVFYRAVTGHLEVWVPVQRVTPRLWTHIPKTWPQRHDDYFGGLL